MIDYINKRLNDWARWRVSDRATVRHMLGVKGCWPRMLKDDKDRVKLERHGTLVPINDLECCDTDRAVCALPADLGLAVMEFYCRLATAEIAAKRCGVCVRTLFNRIDRAHWHIMGTLNDLAAGISAPPVQRAPDQDQRMVGRYHENVLALPCTKAYKTG